MFGIRPAEESDRRITKVGRVLRAMGLDELPQIINIFLRHMNFVGPRSLAVGEIIKDEACRVIDYQHVPGFRRRLRARPGLTSIATIYLPKDSSLTENSATTFSMSVNSPCGSTSACPLLLDQLSGQVGNQGTKSLREGSHAKTQRRKEKNLKVVKWLGCFDSHDNL